MTNIKYKQMNDPSNSTIAEYWGNVSAYILYLADLNDVQYILTFCYLEPDDFNEIVEFLEEHADRYSVDDTQEKFAIDISDANLVKLKLQFGGIEHFWLTDKDDPETF